MVSIASEIENEDKLEERQVAMTRNCDVYSKYKRKPKSRRQGNDMLHFMFLM